MKQNDYLPGLTANSVKSQSTVFLLADNFISHPLTTLFLFGTKRFTVHSSHLALSTPSGYDEARKTLMQWFEPTRRLH